MGSIFFNGERRTPPDPEPEPDWNAALLAVSERLPLENIAGAGNIHPGRAQTLRETCRRIDPIVTQFIADNQTATQATIVQFVRDNTDGFFPAVRFIEIMKANAGGTPALLRAAAIREVGTG